MRGIKWQSSVAYHFLSNEKSFCMRITTKRKTLIFERCFYLNPQAFEYYTAGTLLQPKPRILHSASTFLMINLHWGNRIRKGKVAAYSQFLQDVCIQWMAMDTTTFSEPFIRISSLLYAMCEVFLEGFFAVMCSV